VLPPRFVNQEDSGTIDTKEIARKLQNSPNLNLE